MVKKGKDLFVILAERQQRAKGLRSASGQASPGRSGGRSKAGSSRSKAGSQDGDGLGSAVSGALGRWVSGAVRTMRGDASASSGGSKSTGSKSTGKGSTKSAPSNRGRSASPQQVPRGLLVPGWLLVAMLVASLGFGFAAGHWTGGSGSEVGLNAGEKKPKSSAGNPVPPGPYKKAGAYRELSASEEVERLTSASGLTYFYLVGRFAADERTEAAELARALRQHGMARTRILQSGGGGQSSQYAWNVLYYLPSWADRDRALADLQRLEPELKGRYSYKVNPTPRQLPKPR